MPLSLTRRCGEEIRFRFPDDLTEKELQELLQDGISVSVSDISGRQAILSIAAPRSVNVVRAELLEQ